MRPRGEPYPRTQPPFAVVVAAKASILARSLPSRPGLPETTSRSSFGWFAGVKDRCTDTRPQSSTIRTRSFGHRERSGSALSLRGNQTSGRLDGVKVDDFHAASRGFPPAFSVVNSGRSSAGSASMRFWCTVRYSSAGSAARSALDGGRRSSEQLLHSIAVRAGWVPNSGSSASGRLRSKEQLKC